MPLNKLDNFIKNTEGRILYVNPNDLDATDSINNQGNSLAQPFKTIQRALLEAARFSYVKGYNNDIVEKTTILLFPGEHLIDNRPGYAIYDNGGAAYAVSRAGGTGVLASSVLSLGTDSNFDLTQEDNILYKFNSYYGGIVVPRGTSIVGLDLRKTKIRPKYVPNPTDSAVKKSAIFRVTGACYFWQFSIFDGDETGLVYTNPDNFDTTNQSTPLFSHHKLTCFEFCDGVNNIGSYGITDLDMYYSKVSNAFNAVRDIDQKFPAEALGFAKRRPEWEIVGAFASDPITISNIISGNGSVASSIVTVTTSTAHGLNSQTPIKIKGVSGSGVTAPYNISTKVQSVLNDTTFTYVIPGFDSYPNLNASPDYSAATVTIETDTVSGASPYIFNISLRSVWGMNGLHADGSKASGFRSTVVAQFTAVSLQKDDRAFAKYDKVGRTYQTVDYTAVYGSKLPEGASQTDSSKVYHLDPRAVYRQGWESSHIKITNDAFIQVVSVFAIGFNKHFDAESGGDASITNSNSNFGQISLNSSGFKRKAFSKDNNAFITSIIPPRAIDISTEEKVDWLSLDVGLTTSVGISSHLYLYGYSSKANSPASLAQGYRIGARDEDILYVVGAGVTYSANIYMCDNVITGTAITAIGTNSGKKAYDVTSGPTNNIFTIGVHKLQTGEKVIITSDDGDLPENIIEHTVYYVIVNDATSIKLAASYNDALSGNALTVYLGTNLHIISRVSDKNSGDIGSPIQYDAINSNWYVHVNVNNAIYNALNTLGVGGLSETTDLAYVNRIPDNRSLDEKLYKVRVVIPKELSNAKDPQNGFILQESSSTGARNSADFTRTSIASTDYGYNKNPRFIKSCSLATNTVTVVSELPHNVEVGETVTIKNVTDSSNTSGTDNVGYNGVFAVTEVTDEYTFKYLTTDIFSTTHTPGSFTNNVNTRTTSLPRFERTDWKANLFVYRNEVISNYIEGSQDGIYHLYVLNASNTIPNEFTNLSFSQLSKDLYPQLDRDNYDSDPPAAKTFAKRSPVGDVITNDLKKSVTRESADLLLKDIGIGLTISSVSSSTSSATITFGRNHGLSGIVTYSNTTAGSFPLATGNGYTSGTYYNVKLYNNAGLTIWKGATATVVVSGGALSSVDIAASGSGYANGDVLYFDTAVIGGGTNGRLTLSTAGLNTNVGDVVQFTGTGTTASGHYHITSVPAENQIAIAKTAGDPTIVSTQYGFVVGPSIVVSSTTYSSTTGITTFTCSSSHGLVPGNRFTVVDSSNNNVGNYIVEDRNSVTAFTAVTNKSLSVNSGRILKHGLSSNEGVSDTTTENFGARTVTFYDSDKFTLTSAVTTETSLTLTSSGIGTANRLSLGSYIQVDNEIMRVVSTGSQSTFTVIRGALGTRQESHDANSLVRKINPIAIEFRRPSILRASGHTFEYLGYGPGNYSTGLPDVQVKTNTDKEDFLAQAQERSCGVVVYNGMNNNGDLFNGNTKTSSQSGEIISYDIPQPTVTGEDPSKLSAVFDEVTIKEKLLVEGGSSGTVLSQFDGPVTFNKQIRAKDNVTFSSIVKISDENSTQSNSATTGALVVNGGVGIGKNLYVGGTLGVTGASSLQGGVTIGGEVSIAGEVTVATGIVPDSDEGAYLGTSSKPFSDAHIGEIRIAQTNDNTIDTATGQLTLNATTGSNVAISTSVTITGNLDMTSGSGRISANYLDVPNVTPVGGIVMWPGTVTNFPTGWQICNGAQLSIASYTALYNVLTNNGTIFPFGANTNGSGSAGSTHFRLPNMIDRFVAGAGSAYSVGNTGGADTVTLTTAQMPSHDHTASDSGHSHDYVGVEWPSGGGAEQNQGGSPEDRTNFNYARTTSLGYANITIGLNGSGEAHENRPPYFALIYLIRIQ
jgi:microcystin-dependent protein